nr:hypothetical protein [uncultured Methylophaga sp.]
MTTCNREHRNWPFFESLPNDQGGAGRHKCAGCAYEKGYELGVIRAEELLMNLDDLPESQAGAVRHKSPHAAFALGYNDGVHASYND